MRAERSLEICQHVVAVVGRAVLRDDDVAFHRREREPRIVDFQRDARIRLLERSVGVAVGELADGYLVGPGFGMQDRRSRAARGLEVDHGFERPVFDVHQFGRILGEVAAFGHHQRHRLADIAHALDRQRPLIDRRLQRDQERIGQLAYVLAGDHRPYAGLRQRLGRVDADDVGMRVRRTDHVAMQGAGRYRQVIGIASASGQQRGVFLAKRGRAESGGQRSPRRHCSARRGHVDGR